MLVKLNDDSGTQLDAKVEVSPNEIVIHSRGGAFNKPNLRNPDYRKAVRLIIERIKAHSWPIEGVWLDSSVAQKWPLEERRLLNASEFDLDADALVTTIGQRGAAKGRPVGAEGHGNSTKRLKFTFTDQSAPAILEALKAVPAPPNERLPAATLRQVTPSQIDEAVAAFQSGKPHNFNPSVDYDLLLPNGDRLPPKAIFGLALEPIIGRQAKPTDFSAGWGTPCFETLEAAGYPIVPKIEMLPSEDTPADSESVWAEGSKKRVQHLRRERAPGLAAAKKRNFIAMHGHLFCERCRIVPSKELGEFGDACIEVHHSKTQVADMTEGHATRLSDLQCLCANCHRIVHRELVA